MRVVAFVGDLLDRSKISAAVPDAGFARAAEDAAGADVVVIDVKVHPEAVAAARKLVPDARIVAYGRHDNPEALEAARAHGWTWQQIGDALGVSRQAAHKKHGR